MQLFHHFSKNIDLYILYWPVRATKLKVIYSLSWTRFRAASNSLRWWSIFFFATVIGHGHLIFVSDAYNQRLLYTCQTPFERVVERSIRYIVITIQTIHGRQIVNVPCSCFICIFTLCLINFSIYLLHTFSNILSSQFVSIRSLCHWNDGGGHGDEVEASQR